MKGRRSLLSLVSLMALVGMLAVPAIGHSFLVDTRPGQGERLSSSPGEVVIQFTEAVRQASSPPLPEPTPQGPRKRRGGGCSWPG